MCSLPFLIFGESLIFGVKGFQSLIFGVKGFQSLIFGEALIFNESLIFGSVYKLLRNFV